MIELVVIMLGVVSGAYGTGGVDEVVVVSGAAGNGAGAGGAVGRAFGWGEGEGIRAAANEQRAGEKGDGTMEWGIPLNFANAIPRGP